MTLSAVSQLSKMFRGGLLETDNRTMSRCIDKINLEILVRWVMSLKGKEGALVEYGRCCRLDAKTNCT